MEVKGVVTTFFLREDALMAPVAGACSWHRKIGDAEYASHLVREKWDEV